MCAAAIALSMNACKSKRQKAVNNVVTLQETIGTYTGILPCASCPGIQTRVDISADLTYTLQTRYVDRSEETFTYYGKFTWDADNAIITFDNQLLGQALFEREVLYVLVDGKKKEGENAEHYMLAKIDLNLVGKYWKLLELYGNPITPANNPREAHIIFHIEDNRFSGDAGCNRIMGSYQTKESNQLALSSAATTMMMCLDMETETNFLKALEMVDSYLVQNDTLTLSQAGTATLARFVAVYLR